MPDIKEIIQPKKIDPSTMCEFTIKGDSEFVKGCLKLILGK